MSNTDGSLTMRDIPAVFSFHSQMSNTFKEYKAGASNAIFSLSL